MNNLQKGKLLKKKSILIFILISYSQIFSKKISPYESHLMTTLRNKNTSLQDFRAASHKIGSMLAHKTATHLFPKTRTVQTPLKITLTSKVFNEEIIIIPILRAGLALLPSFLECYPSAHIGIVGMKNNSKINTITTCYYENIPPITTSSNIVILDPVIATGSTALETLHILEKRNIQQEQIVYVSIVACKVGVEKIYEKYPHIKIIATNYDLVMDKEGWIRPGIGDFGDRYFGIN